MGGSVGWMRWIRVGLWEVEDCIPIYSSRSFDRMLCRTQELTSVFHQILLYELHSSWFKTFISTDFNRHCDHFASQHNSSRSKDELAPQPLMPIPSG